MITKPGGARLGVDIPYERVFRFDAVAGQVPTDGVQRSAAVTFGTIATEILNELIDPGFSVRLQKLEVAFSQRFQEHDGDVVGSLIYHWQAREEYTDPAGATGPQLKTGSWIPITATYAKSIGTNTTSEDVVSGYVPVASLPHAPVRFKLLAVGGQPTLSGTVKNSSYIRLAGNVIPGT